MTDKFVSNSNISTVRNVTGDRANFASLFVGSQVDLPDGSLAIVSDGTGESLLSLPEDGALTSGEFHLRSIAAGDGISLNVTNQRIDIDSDITLRSVGTGDSLLAQPENGALTNNEFQLRSIAAGNGITFNVTDQRIDIIANAVGVTLGSAGGDSIVTDGTGPTLEVKGTGAIASGLLEDRSNATSIRFDNRTIRTSDSNGDVPPLIDDASINNSAVGAIAMGASAVAAANNTVSIGRNANCSDTQNIAIGYNSAASSARATAVGSGAIASGVSSVGVGNTVVASGNRSVAIGNDSTATVTSAVAIGDTALANGTRSICIGSDSQTDNTEQIAIGAYVQPTGVSGLYMLGSGNAGLPLTIGRSGFYVGQRTDANNQVTLAYFGGLDWSYIPTRINTRWQPQPTVLPKTIGPLDMGTMMILTAGGGDFTFQPQVNFTNALTSAWGLVGGATIPQEYSAWEFWIVNASGGQITMDASNLDAFFDSTGVAQPGNTANMTDGNVQYFKLMYKVTGWHLYNLGAWTRNALA